MRVLLSALALWAVLLWAALLWTMTWGSSVALAEPPAQNAAKVDLAGKWRVFLPAGFEHEVSLVANGAGEYRFEPAGYNFGGKYKIAEDQLISANQGPNERYVWQIRSPFLLTLVDQPAHLNANYTGAVLFRPCLADQLSREEKEPDLIKFSRGFRTMMASEFFEAYWKSLKDQHKLQGDVANTLTRDEIESVIALEVNIAVALVRSGPDGRLKSTMEHDLFLFLEKGQKFDPGPLPPAAIRSHKSLVALIQTKSGDFGLVTVYPQLTILELKGQVGVVCTARPLK